MGKLNVYDKIELEKQTKEKRWKSKKFLHKPPYKIWLRNRILTELRRVDARGSADIIYNTRRTSQLCWSGIVYDVT